MHALLLLRHRTSSNHCWPGHPAIFLKLHLSQQLDNSVGFGMGGTLAIKTAAHRRRLQAAVSIGGTVPADPETAQGLYCPLMLQQAGQSPQSSSEELDHFCQTAKEADKNVELHTFAEASPGFWYPNSPNYRAVDLDAALEKSLEFLSNLIKKA